MPLKTKPMSYDASRDGWAEADADPEGRKGVQRQGRSSVD